MFPNIKCGRNRNSCIIITHDEMFCWKEEIDATFAISISSWWSFTSLSAWISSLWISRRRSNSACQACTHSRVSIWSRAIIQSHFHLCLPTQTGGITPPLKGGIAALVSTSTSFTSASTSPFPTSPVTSSSHLVSPWSSDAFKIPSSNSQFNMSALIWMFYLFFLMIPW